VVVQNGDTVVLGGLMKDKITETSVKVPLLGDIPLLGWLFRSKTTETVKQNLLVFVTPKIIKQYRQIRDVLDKKLKQNDNFIDKNFGGEDPYKDFKADMIKNLPPVSDLKSETAVTNTALEDSTSETEAQPNNE
jgi:general secretion pathway protein D